MITTKSILRRGGPIIVSAFVFALLSMSAPFSGKSILWWLSRSCSAIEITTYFCRFFLTTVVLFIVPFILAIAFFGACLFTSARVFRMKMSLGEAETTAFFAYLPFMLLFWAPVISCVMLVAAVTC